MGPGACSSLSSELLLLGRGRCKDEGRRGGGSGFGGALRSSGREVDRGGGGFGLVGFLDRDGSRGRRGEVGWLAAGEGIWWMG